MEQGSIEEESGDRWLGSDLAKSLRFYQKAYDCYLQSMDLEPLNLDSYYNSGRLLFHVYIQYNKTEGVDANELSNVDEVIGATNSVLQPLANVLYAHEQALKVCSQLQISPPNDLYFNAAMVYTEVVETFEDEPIESLLDFYQKGLHLYSNLIEDQVRLFKHFLGELQQANQEVNQQVYQDSIKELQNTSSTLKLQSTQEEFISIELVQPVDIYESLINAYRLIQALFDSAENHEIKLVIDTCELAVISFYEIANTLIEKYSINSIQKVDMIENLTESQVEDLLLAQASLKASTITNLDEIFAIWDPIPNSLKKYMIMNDNLQIYIDRNKLNLLEIWRCLCSMANYLKLAQQQLQDQFQNLQKASNHESTSGLIIQICSILIARADIDVQRYQIDIDQAKENQELLLKNAQILLKNAIKFANVSGGLREVVCDKLCRQKKLIDAKLRLCLLEKKTSVEELNEIVGRNKWVKELGELIKLEYYDKFGTQFIVQEYNENPTY